MPQKNYTVRVCLATNSLDSTSEISQESFSSIEPTQQKIQEIAKKLKGSFMDCSSLCCDFSFSSKRSANEFVEAVNNSFSNQVFAEIAEIKSKQSNNSRTKAFKELPLNIPERIAALTPQKIGFLDVEIRYISDDECLNVPEDENHAKLYKTTHINMLCKVTGKVRSKLFAMRSCSTLSQIASANSKQQTEKTQKAKEAGWTLADMRYDGVIRSILMPSALSCVFGGESYPEIQFACTKITVVVYDYFGQQYVGWYFYNENLDTPINFSSFSV